MNGNLYTLHTGSPLRSKLPLPVGDLDLHLIRGSSDWPESTSQTTPRSVQPFFPGLTIVRRTGRQTTLLRL